MAKALHDDDDINCMRLVTFN